MNIYAKIGLIIVAVIAVAGLGYLIFPKSYILMSIAPDNATLSIDGGKPRDVKTGQTILVIAGKHTYALSRDGFATSTVTLESGNNESKEILVALKAQTDAATELLESDASQAVLQRITGQTMGKDVNIINQQNPILNDLPIYARLYSIEACPSQKYPNDSTKIALCVDTSQDGLEPYVRKDIESRGYNPDNYEIIYSSETTTSGSRDAEE